MIPYTKGIITRQAHVGIPDGLYEEEVARNGFFGKYAHFYRKNPPVGWTRIEGPLKPQSFDLNKLISPSISWMDQRTQILYNDDVHIQWANIDKSQSTYFRNADSDELLFCHQGKGVLNTDFGPLAYEPGDYLYIPRGTLYRLDVSASTQFLVVESMSEMNLPDKGMLGQHALFDPAVIVTPEPYSPVGMIKDSEQPAQREYEVQIKRAGAITKVFYPFNPLDVVGWKGTLTAWKINVRDIRPISCDRYHLPPSAHTTFVAENFVVCSFLPRPLENGDPKAMKVPFYHSNIDFDEVLFYHQGEFFSRAGIQTGMITFHPQGIHHGPHPSAINRTANVSYTNEVAVMIDTKRPLKVAEPALKCENKEYWQSWKVNS
jgi:homogentisate 1,2-dioxygenase